MPGSWRQNSGITRPRSPLSPKRPHAAVVIFDAEDIRDKNEEFMQLMEAISTMEGQDIPHPKNISKAEICIYYEYE